MTSDLSVYTKTMAATQSDIRAWFREGVTQEATHLIVVCDTWDHEDYPVYVKEGENPHARAEEFNEKNMQRVMEVYALHLDMESQLAERRAFHYELPPKAKKPS